MREKHLANAFQEHGIKPTADEIADAEDHVLQDIVASKSSLFNDGLCSPITEENIKDVRIMLLKDADDVAAPKMTFPKTLKISFEIISPHTIAVGCTL
jgi:hypothetical protein